jgi:chloride channel 7
LIAAGGSAGVAAAFGAPIGGACFAYEMSMSGNFWNFSMLWKTFITCSFAVLLMSVLQSFMIDGSIHSFRGSVLKFGAI